MKRKNIKDLKICYVAPRYHTNQVPIMEGWSKISITPYFMVQFEGGVEIHDNVNFIKMKPSLLSSKKIARNNKKYDPSTAEFYNIYDFSPSLIFLFKTLKKIKPDIIILRNYNAISLKVIFIASLLRIKIKIMYVQEPIYTPRKISKLKELIKLLFYPKVCFSPVLYYGKENKVDEYKSSRYFVPLIVNPKDNSRPYFNNDKINILMVGKYRDYKRQDLLIDAINLLKDKSNINVSIIGQVETKEEKEYYEELEKRISSYNLNNVIKLLPNIPYKEMNTIYLINDILVLPGKEPASMAVIEALNEGLCVISNKENGTSSYLEEWDIGYTFDSNNINNLVNILEDIIKDKNIIFNKINKAKLVIKEELTFNNYYQNLKAILEKEYKFIIEN